VSVWHGQAEVLGLMAAFERGDFDFDDLMLRLASILGMEKNQRDIPQPVIAAWHSLDDAYAIACSQTISRPIELKLNHDVQGEFEALRRIVEGAALH